ncbi:MAG: L-seryl-tRNA(Sec) selenium transferase [Candidatus Azotimanducaceae bacterium]|uniref:L-seryl-tRNA(Sec) selenium transferase n=1 Tax=OM182 bacterium TaxID=2510334 RepID=A0A520S0C9_9GAMM|nr:L-seryl-tRNA(Sec) selenium transferase [Gammaproteobacteria bacterium]RZO75905.1 MAG: L-seryl-tRNA(Sec) selenium transferase [OM182 bacterium]
MKSFEKTNRPPSIDALLKNGIIRQLSDRYGRNEVATTIRGNLDAWRQKYYGGDLSNFSFEKLIKDVKENLEADGRFSLKSVFNLSGIVLHTNLGRALLPPSAISTIVKVASSPTNLEYDLDTGGRGDRDDHIESLICELTGAEAATVVNNNAAALMLTLNSLALGKEVPLSRGELVEIGGSFRIPEIIVRSGCTLREVGSTNRTHLHDYQNAINHQTAVLMKVYTSNYEIRGYVSEVATSDLAHLAQENNLPLVVDLGSGNLINMADYGLPYEPLVIDAIGAGADAVTFSCDKLLGGPQAGIIIGKKPLIQKIKENPMKRALRVDKMTIAGLYEVLLLYKNPDKLRELLPTLRLLTREIEELEELAFTIVDSIGKVLEGFAETSVVNVDSQIGSGSLPLERLPSKAISITTTNDILLRKIASAFRRLPQPVIGRIHDGSLLFDMRTLEDKEGFLSQLGQLDLTEITG